LAFTIPPAEQVLELGKNRSATMSRPPRQLVLPLSCRRTLPKVWSERLRANRFEAALGYHAHTRDTFEAARTRLSYGERLRRVRRRGEARRQLADALAVFDRLGATPWSRRALAELGVSGEAVGRRDPSLRHRLTPQELQIALVLAQGQTTKEAAATLFLSPKTVEYHLRNAYDKLEVHSREELRAVIGPPPPERLSAGPGTGPLEAGAS